MEDYHHVIEENMPKVKEKEYQVIEQSIRMSGYPTNGPGSASVQPVGSSSLLQV